MLTVEQIRRIAQQSGARDISKVETDIVLTYLLHLLHEKGITEHVAFKGRYHAAQNDFRSARPLFNRP
jgi:hypothetical protein